MTPDKTIRREPLRVGPPSISLVGLFVLRFALALTALIASATGVAAGENRGAEARGAANQQLPQSGDLAPAQLAAVHTPAAAWLNSAELLRSFGFGGDVVLLAGWSTSQPRAATTPEVSKAAVEREAIAAPSVRDLCVALQPRAPPVARRAA